MEGWKEITLGDMVDIGSSKRIYLSDYVEGGIPFWRSKEVIQQFNGSDITLELFITKEKYETIKTKYGVPQIGDLLITSVGTIGVPYLVKHDKPFYFKDGNLIWIKTSKSKESIDPEYLFSFIKSAFGKAKLDSILIGSSQKALTIKGLNSLKLKLPPLNTQRKIASILSAYDDLIENNLKRIKLLEEKAQLTYEEWFVRMKFPGHESTPINEETGLPEGWERKSLGDLCETMQYGYTASASQEEIGPKFLRITDIVDSNINWENVPYCPIEEKNKEKYLLKEGDIVIARTGATVGYAKRINKNSPDAVFASYLIRLKLNEDVDDVFLGVFVESPNFVQIVKNMAGGAAQPNANAPILRKISLKTPPFQLQKNFRETVIHLKDQQQNLLDQNQLLKEARDILLPRLMSGMIEV